MRVTSSLVRGGIQRVYEGEMGNVSDAKGMNNGIYSSSSMRSLIAFLPLLFSLKFRCPRSGGKSELSGAEGVSAFNRFAFVHCPG